MKDNYRNGSYSKNLRSNLGEIELQIPRDRNSEFKPTIVPKYQYDISKIESQIIGLYSKGILTRVISQTLKEMYGVEVDATFVSRVTDKIIPHITEWRNRPLEKTYAMVFIDGIRLKLQKKINLLKSQFT
ncbi:transposase [Mycoplasma sp. 3398]